MQTLSYLTVLISGLILMVVGNFVYQNARLTRNKQIGRFMVFTGSITAASILFFFAFVSASGG